MKPPTEKQKRARELNWLIARARSIVATVKWHDFPLDIGEKNMVIELMNKAERNIAALRP